MPRVAGLAAYLALLSGTTRVLLKLRGAHWRARNADKGMIQVSTYRLTEFTSVAHTLAVEPAGALTGFWERWKFDLWCGNTLIFSGRDFFAPTGWSEDKVAAHALFWATLQPEDCETAQYEPSVEQRVWLDSYADYLSLALLTPDGREIDDLSAYRIDD